MSDAPRRRPQRSAARLLAAALVVAAGVMLSKPVAAAPPTGSAILVTGASSGFGRKATESLAARGYVVYAGARKPEDLEALGRIPNVRPLRLDVTVPADVDAAVARIRADGKGLWGLVNNAGVLPRLAILDTDAADLDHIVGTNTYGPLRLTRAVAPLIAESRGRIVNVSSVLGLYTGRGFGPYSMSKFALEAFSDALRIELQPQGVHVATVNPGGYPTNLGRSGAAYVESVGKNSPAFSSAPQRPAAGPATAAAPAAAAPPAPPAAPDYSPVINAIEHALLSDTPRPRYLAVATAREADSLMRRRLQQLVELNGDQPFAYSRDELVKMLDEALAAPR
jgi:NAD(P)-dependent dehydrogenase (short-subunit alcohol dehydrogenase family)